jgi:nicotinamidase-related amidase
MRKDVILALNMQDNYFSPGGSSYLGESADRVSSAVKEYLRKVPLDIFEIMYSRNVRSPQDDFYAGQKTQCIVGTQDINMIPGLVHGGSLVVTACKPSAVWKSSLVAHLKNLDPTRIILVGAETNAAVLFTAADLRFLGYHVTVPEGMVAARDPYLHNFSITTMVDTLGVEVVKWP